PDSTGRQRQFYDLTVKNTTARGGAGQLVNPRQTRDFDYPANGVFYAEGSIRVRGTVAAGKQLTMVSGGTIYIEGNLLKGSRSTFIGLMAQDFVTLNPTAFTRVRPGQTVAPPEADERDAAGNPVGWHWVLNQ